MSCGTKALHGVALMRHKIFREGGGEIITPPMAH